MRGEDDLIAEGVRLNPKDSTLGHWKEQGLPRMDLWLKRTCDLSDQDLPCCEVKSHSMLHPVVNYFHSTNQYSKQGDKNVQASNLTLAPLNGTKNGDSMALLVASESLH